MTSSRLQFRRIRWYTSRSPDSTSKIRHAPSRAQTDASVDIDGGSIPRARQNATWVWHTCARAGTCQIRTCAESDSTRLCDFFPEWQQPLDLKQTFSHVGMKMGIYHCGITWRPECIMHEQSVWHQPPTMAANLTPDGFADDLEPTSDRNVSSTPRWRKRLRMATRKTCKIAQGASERQPRTACPRCAK